FDNLDDAFLERVRAGYLWEAKQRNHPVVYATDEPDVVADNIWKLVSQTLAVRDTAQAAVTAPASVKEIIEQKEIPTTTPETAPTEDKPVEEKLVIKDKATGLYTVTAAGRRFLQETVTDTDG